MLKIPQDEFGGTPLKEVTQPLMFFFTLSVSEEQQKKADSLV